MPNEFDNFLDQLAQGIGQDESPDSFLDSLAQNIGGPSSASANLQAHGLPAVGSQELESDLTGASKFLRGPGMLISPVGIADRIGEALGQPAGSQTSSVSTALNAGLGWVPGLAERVGILPDGTRQGMNEAVDKERISVASQMNPDQAEAFMVGQGVAEIGGGATPGGIVGRTARVIGAATNLTTKGKAVARSVGVIAEGLAQAAGETAGLEGPEEMKALTLSALLTALGAKVEHGRYISGEINRLGLSTIAKEKGWNDAEAARVAHIVDRLTEIGKIKEGATAEAALVNQERLGALVAELDKLSEDQRADLRAVIALETEVPQLQARVASLKDVPIDKRTMTLDNLRELAKRKQVAQAIDKPQTQAKTPVYIDEQPVIFKEESPNFQRWKRFEDEMAANPDQDPNKIAPHQGVYAEPWMDKIPVKELDKEGYTRSMDEVHDVAAPLKDYIESINTEMANSPRRIRYVRTDGSPIDFLILENGYTGRIQSFVIRPMETGEQRGASIIGGDKEAVAPRPNDKIPNVKEATRVVVGGLEEAEKVVDDSLSGASLIEKMKQAEEEVKLFMWDLYGDPNITPEANLLRIQEGIAAGERMIESLKTRGLEAKARLNAEAPHVATTFEALSAMQRLRETARIEAAKLGDPTIFDAYDIEYRRKKSEPGFLESVDMQKRTLEDALSQHQDAFYATLERQRKRAAINYKKMVDESGGVYNLDGTIQTVEEFVLDQTNAAIGRFQESLKGILERSVQQGVDPTALTREIDLRTRAMLRQARVPAKKVGFRADLAMTYQGITDAGAEWINRALGADDTLTSVTDDGLIAMARKAKAENAPLSVYNFLEAEANKRINGVAPRKLALRNPQELSKLTAKHRERVSDDLRNSMFGGDLKEAPTTWLGRTVAKLLVTAKTQAAADLQVSYSGGIPFSGRSLYEPLFQLANPKERRRALSAIRNVIPEARAEEGLILHRMTVALHDLDTAVDGYMNTMKQQGIKINKDAMYAQVKEAYEDGNLSVLPPEIQNVIRTAVQPRLDELSKIVDSTIPDAKKRVAIKANMGRYVFRSYAIFSDKDAIFKRVDRNTKPYQKLYEALKAKEYDDIKDAAYELYGKQLRDAGLEKGEIDTYIDMYVDQEIHGKIASLVKQHLEYPKQKTGSTPVIKRIHEDYLKDLLLEDPNLRKIMGEEQNFAYAAHITAAKIASDVAAYKIYKGLLEEYRKVGLVADHSISGVADVPLSSRTLERIKESDPDYDGKVVFVNAKVGELFRGVQEHGDALSFISNRLIALTKAGFVLSPGGLLANIASIPQSVLVGAGLTHGLRAIFADSVIAAQLAKELSNPGSAGHLPDNVAKRLFHKFGYETPEQVRTDAEDLLRLGLDVGGEIHSYFEEGSRALIETYHRSGGSGRRLPKVLTAAQEVYRRPDVFAKVIVYRSILNELMDKALVDAPTEAIKREAAKRALNLTQNPMTTPSGVRNLSRGITGLVTFGFQGFFYQQMRNFYYGAKYATQDAFTSMKYLDESVKLYNNGDMHGALEARLKAQKHGKYSLDRATGVVVGGYLVYEAVSNFLGEENDKEEHIRHFLWADQRNGRYLINSVDRDEKTGKIVAKVVQLGATDYFDQTSRMINILLSDQTMMNKLLLAKNEMAMQLFQPSALVEAAADLFGYEMTNKDLKTAALSLRARSSLPKEQILVGSGERGQAGISVEGIQKATRRMIPTIGRAAWDLLSVPFRDPLDPIQDRQQFQLLRQSTGIRAQKLEMNKLVARRYNEDWNKNATWLGQMKTEWKAARSPMAQANVIKKYERNWDKAYSSIIENTAHANEIGYKRGDLVKLFDSDEYYSVLPGIVKQFAVSSRQLTLRQYLGTIE